MFLIDGPAKVLVGSTVSAEERVRTSVRFGNLMSGPKAYLFPASLPTERASLNSTSCGACYSASAVGTISTPRPRPDGWGLFVPTNKNRIGLPWHVTRKGSSNAAALLGGRVATIRPDPV